MNKRGEKCGTIIDIKYLCGRLWVHSDKIKYSIKYKLFMLSATVAVPFLIMVVYLIYALHNYSNAYDTIVSNMTVANNYNLNFKEEMDESLYKLVVGSVTFETV